MTSRATIACLFPGAAGLLAPGNPDWHRAFPGFKVGGNLYCVGTSAR